MPDISLEAIYKKVDKLQRDVNQIKKILTEEPKLRKDFIKRISDIDDENTFIVKDFGERYGLK